jgi:hypothetical protein
MSTELIAAELKIRLTSFLSCTEIDDFLLSKLELLKLIHPNEKYCTKRQHVNYQRNVSLIISYLSN